MKPQIRVPYFEIGTKNYVYGDTLLEYAIAADKAAEKYDIDVLFICPALEVRRVAENTKHLFVLMLPLLLSKQFAILLVPNLYVTLYRLVKKLPLSSAILPVCAVLLTFYLSSSTN